MTQFIGEVSRFSVWTSDSEGDLFQANIIEIDKANIHFYLNTKLIKTYIVSEFIIHNPKLFEVIKEK